MTLPILIEKELLSIEKKELDLFFKDECFGSRPVLIDTTELINQPINIPAKKVIGALERFIAKKQIPISFPYPIYILCEFENYNGRLNIVTNRINLPKLFIRKEKKPNIKEVNLLNKNQLKIDKINSTPQKEIQAKIRNIAIKHKEIYLESFEGEYLESLIRKIRS
ncbi:MAG: hypothetical protein ACI9QD_001037 [Thermoproteota archaeon]|jgi:hypothetical protein